MKGVAGQDQAAALVGFGGVTDEAGGLVDDQELGILEDDLEQFLHLERNKTAAKAVEIN